MENQLQTQNKMELLPKAVLEIAVNLPKRDLIAVQNNVVSVICASPKLAMECIYQRPIGRDKNGLQTFASGPSVRFTETMKNEMGRIWMYPPIITRERVQGQRWIGLVTAEVTCFDLQSMNSDTGVATSKVYSEQMWETAEGSAISKANRNAMYPKIRPLFAAIEEKIKERIISYLCGDGEEISTKKALEKLQADFEVLGVTKEQLKNITSKEVSGADKAFLLNGIYNSIRDGLLEAADVFGKVSGSSTKPNVSDVHVEKPAPQEQSNKGEKKRPADVFKEDLLKVCGIIGLKDEASINNIISAEFGYESIEKVKASDRQTIVSHFEKMIEE